MNTLASTAAAALAAIVPALVGAADCPDLTASLEELGNPTLERWSSPVMANSVQDLQAYGGKVYLGTGDWDNNKGPIPMWAFDPARMAFTNEFSAGTDCAEVLRVFSDGRLYVPATDPRDGDANVGSIFRRTPQGDWTIVPYYTQSQLQSSSHTSRFTTHVWDVAELGGALFMSGYGLARSADDGVSWQLVDDYYPYSTRQSSLIRCGGDLYALGESTAYFSGSSQSSGTVDSKIVVSGIPPQGIPVMWRWNEASGVFETYTNSWVNMAPGLTVGDTALIYPSMNYGSVSVRAWHPTPFGERCLYVVGDTYTARTFGDVSDVAPVGTRPMIAVSAVSADDGKDRKTLTGTRIALPAKTYPIDFTVVGGDAYMLTIAYNAAGQNVRHGIWKSSDGVSFAQIATFDYQQVMMSLEYLEGYFYLGVAHKNAQIPLGTLKSGTKEKAGSVYRVRLPQADERTGFAITVRGR